MNFQRVDSVSNTHVGNDFEESAQKTLAAQGLELTRDFGLPIGVGNIKKEHRFDLGSALDKVIVECKSHRWTTGGNVPSAKMTVWNEAMYYFALAPKEYRKILFVLRDHSAKRGESLAEYYIRTHNHLVPNDVEIWEFDESKHKTVVWKRILNRLPSKGDLDTAPELPEHDRDAVVKWLLTRQDYRERITIDPDVRNGKPCIRGMRITVYDVLGYLASGMSQDEILDDFPYLEPEDIRASLAFAADIEHRFVTEPSY